MLNISVLPRGSELHVVEYFLYSNRSSGIICGNFLCSFLLAIISAAHLS